MKTRAPEPREAAPCADGRGAIVEDAAHAVAHAWADAYRRTVVEEGRLAKGGWPGTMSEARARVSHGVGLALSSRSLPALTTDEIARATLRTYREARRVWTREIAC